MKTAVSSLLLGRKQELIAWGVCTCTWNLTIVVNSIETDSVLSFPFFSLRLFLLLYYTAPRLLSTLPLVPSDLYDLQR